MREKTAVQKIIETLEEGIKMSINEIANEKDASSRLAIKAMKRSLEAVLELAKGELETERQQIIDAFESDPTEYEGEQYYNDKYGK